MLYLRDGINKALRRFCWENFTSSDKQAISKLENCVNLFWHCSHRILHFSQLTFLSIF